MINKVKLSKLNGVLTNNLYADVHFLNEENFGDIIKLYETVSSSMDNKGWLKSRDFSALKKTIDDGGFIVGCYVNSELIACALCDVPSANDMDLLLGLDIQPLDIKNTYVSGFVMVHPMYRGNSLQLTLLDVRIDTAKNKGKKYIITVAAVENTFSANNILSRGFELKTQRENEYGILRNIFVKNLSEDVINENIITA